MIRILLAVAALLVAAAGPAPAPAPDAAQARTALEVLKNDKKRAELIATLEAIAKAQSPAPAEAPAQPPSPAPAAAPAPGAATVIPLAPDSLGAQLLAGASDRLSSLSDDLVGLLRAATDFPLIWYWLQGAASDAATRMLLIQVGWRLAVALAVALAVEAGLRHLLRRPMRALARRAPERTPEETADARGIAEAEAGQTEDLPSRAPLLALLRRLPYALGGLGLELLPVVGMLLAGYACIGAGLAADFAPRYVILGVLHAIALQRTVMALARTAIAARAPRLTLFHPPPAAAAAALGWVRRISLVAIYGVTITETALLFGMYRLAHDTVLKLLALVVVLMLCTALLRHRGGIAAMIRPPAAAAGVAATLRRRIAELWHIVACLYLLSLWLIWALDLPDGFTRLLRITLVTAVVLAAARLAGSLLLGSLRALTPPPDADADGLGFRLRRYHPVLRQLARTAIALATLMVLLEAWGVPAFGWFTADRLGGRLVGAVTNLAVTVVVALVTWEAANLAVERHLARLSAEHQIARSARLRTLLPMLRTTLLVAICMFTGLMALSEIGVNIAPLLAGAGVVGLAIGFGSQKLVQDIITGLFLLLENTMQVGDSVTLGGLSGTVEALSVRTIRLRAVDGAVHIIPFSAVSTVTNETRDFNCAVLDVRVGLSEQPERITAMLREIGAALRAEPDWCDRITEDINVLGIVGFHPQYYTLRALIRTRAGGHWSVAREMNRRIKERFDAERIDSPLTSWRALGLDAPARPQAVITG